MAEQDRAREIARQIARKYDGAIHRGFESDIERAIREALTAYGNQCREEALREAAEVAARVGIAYAPWNRGEEPDTFDNGVKHCRRRIANAILALIDQPSKEGES